MQPQGASIVGPVGLGVAFIDCGFHDGADRRIGIVVCACKHVCAQIVHAGRLIHQVKAQIVSTASGHFELVIVRCAFASVLQPLITTGVGNAFAATIGIHIRRRIHAELVSTASACCRYMERGLLAELRVVPLDGEHDIAALCGGAVLVVRSCVRRLDFKRDFAGATVVLVVRGHDGRCLADCDVVLVGDGVLVARYGGRRDSGHHGIARVANISVLDAEHAGVDRLRCMDRYLDAGDGVVVRRVSWGVCCGVCRPSRRIDGCGRIAFPGEAFRQGDVGQLLAASCRDPLNFRVPRGCFDDIVRKLHRSGVAPRACDGDGGGAHLRVVCVRYGVVAALLEGRGHLLLDRRSRVGDVIGIVEERELGDVKLRLIRCRNVGGNVDGRVDFVRGSIDPIAGSPAPARLREAHCAFVTNGNALKGGAVVEHPRKGIRVLAEFRHIKG